MKKLTINPLEAILTSSKKRRVKMFPYVYGVFLFALCTSSSGFGFENMSLLNLMLLTYFNAIVVISSLFFVGWIKEKKEDVSFYLYHLMNTYTVDQIYSELTKYSEKRKINILKNPRKIIFLITPLALLLSGNLFTFLFSIILGFIVVNFAKKIDVIVNDAILLCETIKKNS